MNEQDKTDIIIGELTYIIDFYLKINKWSVYNSKCVFTE